MFFELDMRRLVVVEPQKLGDALHTQRAMIRRLLNDMDTERCSEEHGYYVTVTTLENVSEGRVRPSTGSVVFWVDFKCIVFRPIRNEVVEAEVTEVIYNGFLAGTPFLFFVSSCTSVFTESSWQCNLHTQSLHPLSLSMFFHISVYSDFMAVQISHTIFTYPFFVRCLKNQSPYKTSVKFCCGIFAVAVTFCCEILQSCSEFVACSLWASTDLCASEADGRIRVPCRAITGVQQVA